MNKKRLVFGAVILLMICSMLGVAAIKPQSIVFADKGGTHDCEPWPDCKNSTEPPSTEAPATEEQTVAPSETHSPGECGPGQHDENGTCVPNGGGDDEGNPCPPGQHDDNGTCVPNGGGGGNGCQNQGNGNGEEDQGGGNVGCDPTETPVTPTDTPVTPTIVPCDGTDYNGPDVDGCGQPTETPVTPTDTPVTPTLTPPADDSNGCPWWKRWLGLCNPQPVTCTQLEAILYVLDDDVYSIESLSDVTPTNLTAAFDYPVSNPDGLNCQYVAEVTRNGQKDIALFSSGGFVRWLTDASGDDTSPTWDQSGNIDHATASGQMLKIDVNGQLVKELGPGTNPVNANNRNLMAYTNTTGNIVVGDIEFQIQGRADNFDWLQKLLYVVDPEGNFKTLNYETGEVTNSDAKADGFAPNPNVAQDGIASIEVKLWHLAGLSSLTDGIQPDWWKK